MWTEARLGLRNLSRRKSRSILTAVMIAGGTLLVVWTVGLAEGNYAKMIDLVARTYTGHLQIVADGYHERPSLFATVRSPDAAASQLAAQPGVAAVSRRVETAGLLASGNHTTASFVIGVQAGVEGTVSTIPNWVKDGRWLPAQRPADTLPIVIGRGLARRLHAGVDTELSFVGQAADGSVAADLFTVVGIVESGTHELDAQTAFVRLADLQETLALGDRVHRLVAIVDDARTTPAIAAAIEPTEGNRTMAWYDLTPGLATSIESDRAGYRVTVFVIVLMVLLGVLNTMMMSVFERTRELGVMLAIGATPRHVLTVTLMEAAWLSLLGVVAGALAGTAIVWLVPIPLGDAAIQFSGITLTEIRGIVGVEGSVIVPAVILASGIVAALIPALRAARLDPVQAIRKA